MEDKKPLDFSNATTAQVPPLPPLSGKRKLTNADFHSSSYFKIRNLVPNLFRYSRHPTSRIARQLMNSEHIMPLEADPITKVVLDHQPSSAKPKYKKQSWNEHQDFKVPELRRDRQPSDKSAEMKATKHVSSQVKFDEGHVPINYVIGASVVGWNYIFFQTCSPVYYGVTKESFRKSLRSKKSAATNVFSHKT